MWEPIGAQEQKLHVATLDFSKQDSRQLPVASALVLASVKPLPLDKSLFIPFYGCGDFKEAIATAQKNRLRLDTEQIACAKQFTRSLLRAVLNRPLELQEHRVAFLILPARWAAGDDKGRRRVRHINILWEDMDMAITDTCRPIPVTSSFGTNSLGPFWDGMTTYRAEFSARFYIEYEIEVDGDSDNLGDGHLALTRASATGSYLDPSSVVAPRTPSIDVPIQNCLLYGINASVYRAAQCIPSILTVLDDLLAAQHINEKYFNRSLPVVDLAKALCAPSALRPWNYQRLELLGDVMLKLMATTCLYITQPAASDEALNAGRSKIVNNKQLAESMTGGGLHDCIRHVPLRMKEFVPAGFICEIRPAKGAELAPKRIADVAEALIGAASDCGSSVEKAFAVAKRIGVDLPARSWPLLRAGPIFQQSGEPSRTHAAMGYKFRNLSLLAEAVSMSDDVSPRRQRLEFLGDAVLDYLIMTTIQKEHSKETEGDMCLIKESAVNNQVLAALSIDVGLHKIMTGTAIDRLRIDTFEQHLVSAKYRRVRPYWRDHTAPKCLVVALKAVLGAIFEDAAFDVQPLGEVFDNHLNPFYDDNCLYDLEEALLESKKRKRK